jgi:hypothetical protein
MVLSMSTRKVYFLAITGLLAMMLLLAACGSTTASAPKKSSTNSNNSTLTLAALMKLMTPVGQPTAKMVSGTTFQVNGQLKNGDAKQHDITVQATLLDASGKVIATATQFLDNVKGGATVSYHIAGTTPQPTWTSVQVTVIKISENINGSGDD